MRTDYTVAMAVLRSFWPTVEIRRLHSEPAGPTNTYAQTTFTFSRTARLRDGFKYRMVDSISE